jgi:hypothetical protein
LAPAVWAPMIEVSRPKPITKAANIGFFMRYLLNQPLSSSIRIQQPEVVETKEALGKLAAEKAKAERVEKLNEELKRRIEPALQTIAYPNAARPA